MSRRRRALRARPATSTRKEHGSLPPASAPGRGWSGRRCGRRHGGRRGRPIAGPQQADRVPRRARREGAAPDRGARRARSRPAAPVRAKVAHPTVGRVLEADGRERLARAPPIADSVQGAEEAQVLESGQAVVEIRRMGRTPISRCRSAGAASQSSPFSQIRPALGRINRAIALRSVVFPAPSSDRGRRGSRRPRGRMKRRRARSATRRSGSAPRPGAAHGPRSRQLTGLLVRRRTFGEQGLGSERAVLGQAPLDHDLDPSAKDVRDRSRVDVPGSTRRLRFRPPVRCPPSWPRS